jgi:hypothetical protein
VSRFAFAWLLIARVAGFAQTPLEPDRIPQARSMFDEPAKSRSIACEVKQLKPHLNFSLRLQAGYVASWPLKNYAGRRHWFVVLTRVTPLQSDGEPAFFRQGFSLSKIPPGSKEKLQVDGAYFLGEGHYNIDLLVFDNDGHQCQKSWRIEAKLPGKAELIKVAQAPGSVLPVGFERWNGVLPNQPEDGTMGRRLTILMHVTPLYARSNRLHAYDRALLLSSLLSLLKQTSFSQIKLVAFNLDQQKELVHEERFDVSGWDKLVQATGQLELGTVSYQVLQQRRGHADLLTRLVDQELKAEQPPDVVLFLGPTARQEEKLRLPPLETEAARPLFAYFEYRPYWSRGDEFPDIIYHLTRSQGGKVFRIHSPREFVDAIQIVNKADSRSVRATLH